MAVPLLCLAVLVVLATALDTTSTTTTTTASAAHQSPPFRTPNHIVLHNLLQELSYSEDCVAAALDMCAVAPRESQFVTLVKVSHYNESSAC